MSLQPKLLCFAYAITLAISLAEQSSSQELKKVRADYFSGGVQYSPDDPWVRSKVFRAHTGHSGLFYNCDNEECKRHSPYIYWTTNCQPLWPKYRGLIKGMQTDLDKVRRRINNGGCGCESCASCQSCENCQGPRSYPRSESRNRLPETCHNDQSRSVTLVAAKTRQPSETVRSTDHRR